MTVWKVFACPAVPVSELGTVSAQGTRAEGLTPRLGKAWHLLGPCPHVSVLHPAVTPCQLPFMGLDQLCLSRRMVAGN